MDNNNHQLDIEKPDLESSKTTPNPKDLKYPKSVFFIIGNEFCERFCYYGMKAVLVLYFTKVLNQSEDNAVASYHEFILLCYFTPLIGAILADSYLGKFRTILYLSLLYAAGNIALSASSYIENALLSIFSLGLIAFGTGGIKPCVSAFGGDQFVAGQEDQLNKFFAIFYMSINMGSLFSTFITPILRSDVSCSERGDCFPLAFGVPAALMTVALLLFVIGKPSYRIVEVAKGNVIFKFFQCNAYAFGLKLRSIFSPEKGLQKQDHWLDYAEDKFSPKLINDVKTVNRVLFLYLPLPLFWALFDQQGSRWTLQALKMDGILFSEKALKPDQIQVINPILIVAMIPVFQYVFYPIMDRLGICRTSLQRMTVGGLLAAISFVIAALIQISLESETPNIPSPMHGSLTLINSLPCAVSLVSMGNFSMKGVSLESGSVVTIDDNLPIGPYRFDLQTKFPGDVCIFTDSNVTIKLNEFSFSVPDREMLAVQLFAKKLENSETYISGVKSIFNPLLKPAKGDAYIQIAYSLASSESSDELMNNNHTSTVGADNTTNHRTLSILFSKSPKGSVGGPELLIQGLTGLTNHTQIETFSGIESYHVVPKIGSLQSEYSVKVRNGAYYILVITQNPFSGQVDYNLNKVVDENHMSMLWQIPQYFIITCGEVMFSITGLEFSYSQAPTSMKSVVQAAWLLTVSFGNFFVALITKYIKFTKQSNEFFFFAGLMTLDMVLFAIMSYFYTYSNQSLEDDGSTESIELPPVPAASANGNLKINGHSNGHSNNPHDPHNHAITNGSAMVNGQSADLNETKPNDLQDTKL